MAKRLAILTVGLLLAGTEASAQSAGEALRGALFGPNEFTSTGALSEDSTATLYGLLLGETATFPVGTSAGGFTWIFDSNLRVPIRRSASFGPMFAERPFTTGRRRLNVGALFQHTSFVSVGGQPLTELEYFTSYSGGEEVYNYTSSVEIAIDRWVVSATYGIFDKLDVGVILPLGNSRVSGVAAFYQLVEGEESTTREEVSGSSFGLGDFVIRTKAALIASRTLDAAVALDLRLPTGDTEKLLGTGHMQTKLLFIAGTTVGSAMPHVNLGYTFGGSGMKFGPDDRWEGSEGDPALIEREPSEEFNYTVGADVAATPRITVAGDLIGRIVKNSASMRPFAGGSEDADVERFLAVTPGTQHLLLGAVGVKVNIGGSWLATATILFPLNDNGIRPAVTPVVGFERSF
ncbi:MAG TPA: transporter [Vicinamibacterales bacterium]|nr:transporter [Vicinamibacterales bacterium]